MVVIHKGADSFNTYSKVVNAYKITNAKRTYLNTDNCFVSYHTTGNQVAREYLNEIGFNVPTRLSDAQNIVVIEHDVKYRDLKKIINHEKARN